jgi:hypothetical protein
MPAGYASNPQPDTTAGTEASGATLAAAAATIINIDAVDPSETASVYMAAEATTAILAAEVDDAAAPTNQGSGDVVIDGAAAAPGSSPAQVTLTQTLVGIQPQQIDLETAAAAMQQTLQTEGLLTAVTASTSLIQPSAGRRLRQDRGGSILVYLITSVDGSSQRQAMLSDDLVVAEQVTAELLQRRVAAVASSPEAVQRVLEHLALDSVSAAEVAASSVIETA